MRMMKAIFVLMLATLSCFGQQSMNLGLMPWPEKLTMGQGRFPLESGFAITSEKPMSERVSKAAAGAMARISGKTGIPMPVGPAGRGLQIAYTQETGVVPKLGDDESYQLTV